ncbi:hypothetical protein LCGC14_0739870 [marine sediment metagenome]|uniref:Tetracyclin repressor-like C-terminal domain-containing protein n=1 Tax=marine sediment metagenome TaxID=412755 RepID=A0A0F9SRZ8_9ZZZZ
MKMMMDRWTEFSNKVIPKDAPDMQREEMCRAFYAGAQSTLWSLREMSIESSDTNLDEGADMIQLLFDECEAYFKRIGGKLI